MSQIFTNNASATLSVQAEIIDTVLTLQTNEGQLFPNPTGSDFFQCTLEDTSGNIEIVQCTGRGTPTSDDLTVVRAQESTTAKVFPTGSKVELRPTAGTHDSFLQIYGGVMQGELDMNDEQLTDPLIVGGEARSMPLRGADGGTANQIVVPTAAGAPTIGSNNIFHVGNLPNFVLTSYVLTGGEGIEPIGDLVTPRTINLDIPSLFQQDGANVLADDDFLVYDAFNSTHKRIAYQDAGIPIITDSGTNPVPTSAEMNMYWICTNGSTINFDIDTGVGKKGNIIMVEQGGAGVVDFTGGTATINSAFPNDQTETQNSVAVLICTADDVWTLAGDLN